jgi:hypothetical protein
MNSEYFSNEDNQHTEFLRADRECGFHVTEELLIGLPRSGRLGCDRFTQHREETSYGRACKAEGGCGKKTVIHLL